MFSRPWRGSPHFVLAFKSLGFQKSSLSLLTKLRFSALLQQYVPSPQGKPVLVESQQELGLLVEMICGSIPVGLNGTADSSANNITTTTKLRRIHVNSHAREINASSSNPINPSSPVDVVAFVLENQKTMAHVPLIPRRHHPSAIFPISKNVHQEQPNIFFLSSSTAEAAEATILTSSLPLNNSQDHEAQLGYRWWQKTLLVVIVLAAIYIIVYIILRTDRRKIPKDSRFSAFYASTALPAWSNRYEIDIAKLS